MTKLTDSQLVVLSAAAARDDGVAVLPWKMRKAAAMKVGTSLIARKLMRETRAKPGTPLWRTDESGRSIALLITKTGLKAINAEATERTAKPGAIVSPAAVPVSKAKDYSESQEAGQREAVQPSGGEAAKAQSKSGRSASQAATGADPGRAGSKQALIVGMLSGSSGATLDAMIAATGWLPHTTRAMLTGLRKKGFALERVRQEGVTTYRLTGQPGQAGA